MTRFRLVSALCACLVLGSLAGWLRPLPVFDSAAGGGHEAAWQLPTKETLERSSAALSSRTGQLRWQGESAAGGGSVVAEAQEWTLKAILSEEGAILLQSGKGTSISRASVGTTLPDGSRLLALKGDVATVELDGCRIDRHLYPRASSSDSPECQAATIPKDPQQP